MRRRRFISVIGATSVFSLSGCVNDGASGCPKSEVIEIRVEPATINTPTPRGDETPTPAPITEDYVVVKVRNDAEASRILTGYVVSSDGRSEFSRTLPGNAGVKTFKFGPFGHHTIQDYDFSIEDC